MPPETAGPRQRLHRGHPATHVELPAYTGATQLPSLESWWFPIGRPRGGTRGPAARHPGRSRRMNSPVRGHEMAVNSNISSLIAIEIVLERPLRRHANIFRLP